jgi:hypothetical protein
VALRREAAEWAAGKREEGGGLLRTSADVAKEMGELYGKFR